MVKISIDQDECAGCGACYEDECPDVFEESPDGTARIKEDYRSGSEAEGEVPDSLKDCVQNAVDGCPVDAITIE